jgi:putative transposase
MSMPTSLIRYQETGNLHFINFSCYQRNTYLAAPESRDRFEQSLETMRIRYDFFVCGYVVMPDHVHLLLSEPKKAILAKAIQAIKLSVSVQRTERPFWQARYYDFNVFTREKRIEKLKYMHRNPVKSGLVAKPEEWAWSSFRHYLTGETKIVQIESHWLLWQRESLAASTQVSTARPGPPNSVT